MARKKEGSEEMDDEDLEEAEVGTQQYVPEEAASHDGLGTYKVVKDTNIKHQDYKAGDTVFLTYEEYQTLRGLGVHCEAVEASEGG